MHLTMEQRGSKGKVSVRVRRAPFVVSDEGHGGALQAPPPRPLGGDSCSDHALAVALEGILEQTVLLATMPQLLFELSIDIVGSSVADLPCAAIAANAALLHAGVQCADVLAGATVALCADGSVLFDPRQEELATATALCTVCACTGTGALVHVVHRGAVDAVAALALVEAAAAACVSLRDSICTQLQKGA
jgi:ribonuclease PH